MADLTPSGKTVIQSFFPCRPAQQFGSFQNTYDFSVRMEYPFSRIRCLTLSKSFTGELSIISP
jgi:hypothetical protein